MSNGSDIPFGHIRIDKEGVWYYKGAEMFRKEIVNLFYSHLRQDDASGLYVIELENDRCYLDVEDTAFVVRSAWKTPSAGGETADIRLLLSDDTVEALDAATLRVGAGNVLYCRVKSGRFEARFQRAAYYQMADHIEQDTNWDAYFVAVNGTRFYIMDRYD